MKGCRSGVQSLIKRECPDVLDVGCICHLADLTIKAGMGTLPVDIDQLFIDVFYYFYHSSKRKQAFTDLWCSLFMSEPKAIIKHCETRWLSLLRCIGRFLHQFDGLLSSFFLVMRLKPVKQSASYAGQKTHSPNLFCFSSLLSCLQWIDSIICSRSQQRSPPVSCTPK